MMRKLLPCLLLALALPACNWSERRCAEQSAKERLIERGMSAADVERVIGKVEPAQADSDRWCEAAGGTREVQCLVCDSRWDQPRWWPSGSHNLDYLVICLDRDNRVVKTTHHLTYVN